MKRHPAGRGTLAVGAPASLLFIAHVVLTACAGCDGGEATLPDRAAASGSVTFQGKPLPGGVITFVSKQDPLLRTSANIYDGTFSTDRAPIGACRIAIHTASLRFGNPSAYVRLPARYRDANDSGLTAELQPGANELNFALEE